jgi:hypothetical protein
MATLSYTVASLSLFRLLAKLTLIRLQQQGRKMIETSLPCMHGENKFWRAIPHAIRISYPRATLLSRNVGRLHG